MDGSQISTVVITAICTNTAAAMNIAMLKDGTLLLCVATPGIVPERKSMELQLYTHFHGVLYSHMYPNNNSCTKLGITCIYTMSII